MLKSSAGDLACRSNVLRQIPDSQKLTGTSSYTLTALCLPTAQTDCAIRKSLRLPTAGDEVGEGGTWTAKNHPPP